MFKNQAQRKRVTFLLFLALLCLFIFILLSEQYVSKQQENGLPVFTGSQLFQLINAFIDKFQGPRIRNRKLFEKLLSTLGVATNVSHGDTTI